MSKKAGYYKDKAGDTWLRLGKVAIVYEASTSMPGTRPTAVWSWKIAKANWGPMVLDTPLMVD